MEQFQETKLYVIGVPAGKVRGKLEKKKYLKKRNDKKVPKFDKNYKPTDLRSPTNPKLKNHKENYQAHHHQTGENQ